MSALTTTEPTTTEPDADAPIPYALTPKAIAMLDRALYVPPLSEDEGQTEGAVSQPVPPTVERVPCPVPYYVRPCERPHQTSARTMAVLAGLFGICASVGVDPFAPPPGGSR